MELSQSDVLQIRNLMLRHPRDAFISQDFIRGQWKQLGYLAPPDFNRAIEEYEKFLEIVRMFVPHIHFMPRDGSVTLDSIYVRDASVVCSKGAILCNMGKAQRQSEPQAQERFFKSNGIPVLGRISGSGTLEGGDVVWLKSRVLAVGRTYRTNENGIGQLKTLLGDCIDELIVVDLPHWRGPNDVFHLMSIISPIDHDLALVYSPLLPISFREKLLSMSITLIEVPHEEFETMGCNVLALAPRRCLMLYGNPGTRKRLEKHGVEVYEYEGREVSIKGGGGPTCLTRPIVRQ